MESNKTTIATNGLDDIVSAFALDVSYKVRKNYPCPVEYWDNAVY